MKELIKEIKKAFKIIFITVIAFFVLIWVGNIIECEITTLIHKNEFPPISDDNTMIGDIEYFKIIKYDKEEARLYYVSKNRSSGNIISYKKDGNGKWIYSSWDETVWSKSGSADGFLWPYGR